MPTTIHIEDIIREAAETLRELPELFDIPVIEEDKGDVYNTLATSLAKTNVALVIGYNGFTPTIQGQTAPEDLIGSTSIVVSIFEKPVVNRAKLDHKTLFDLARIVANTLHNAASAGMYSPLFLKSISPITELAQSGSAVVSCDVEFETKAVL